MSQKTRSEIGSLITAYITDNSNNEITAAQVREILNNINDSSLNLLADALKLGLSEHQAGFAYKQGQAVIYQDGIAIATKDNQGAFQEADWRWLLQPTFNLGIEHQHIPVSFGATTPVGGQSLGTEGHIWIDRNINYKSITLSYSDPDNIVDHVTWPVNPLPGSSSLGRYRIWIKQGVPDGLHPVTIIASDGQITRSQTIQFNITSTASYPSSIVPGGNFTIISGSLQVNLQIVPGVYEAGGTLIIQSGANQIGLWFDGVFIPADPFIPTTLNLLSHADASTMYNEHCLLSGAEVLSGQLTQSGSTPIAVGDTLTITGGNIVTA